MRRLASHHGGGTPGKITVGHNIYHNVNIGEKRAPKGPTYSKGLREEYSSFISGHELLTLPIAMEAMTMRTISLLTTDVKTWKLIAVSRETMKEALKALNTGAKVLARRSNAMWDNLLAT